MDGAGLDRCGLSGHPHDFVAVRINPNGMDIIATKILNEAEP
jgi:hypothetical protein